MTNFSRFLKQNKKVRENIKYAPTKDLVDENGNPLEWEFKPISTSMNDEIREQCTIEVQIPGKVGFYRPKVNNSKYLAKLLVASTVYPDLHNKELQDSYGVMTPEDLVKEMIDNPGEYNDLIVFIQNYNGFTKNINEKVEEAKNL